MNPLRLTATELRRLTSGRMPRIAVVALVTIPLLYAGLYLYANRNPYANLKDVPAAIVMSDEPATTADGTTVDAGSEVVDELLDKGTFEWHQVDAVTAAEGVRDGTYLFALTVPADFSASLAQTLDDDPRTASLELTTNDANNYVVHKVATSLATTVAAETAASFGADVDEGFIDGLITIRSDLGDAVDGSGDLADGAEEVTDGAEKLEDGSATLTSGLRTLKSKTADMPEQTEQLADGAAQVATGADKLATGSQKVATGATKVATGATTLQDGADTLATGLKKLRTATKDLPDQTQTLADGATSLSTALGTAADRADTLATGADSVATGTESLAAAVDAQLAAAGADQATRTAIAARFTQLTAGATQVSTGVATLDTGLGTLADASGTLADGTTTLADASDQLATGIAQAATGATALSSGAGTLATGATKVATGATTVSTGLDTLATGAGTVATGTTSLADAAGTLADAVSDATAGSSTITHGLATLASGSGEVADGATTLHDELADGRSEITEFSSDTKQETAETLADPVEVVHDAITTAHSYGAGLAPFFMSLAAWIGGYVLFLLVRPVSARAVASGASPLAVAVGGWLAPALLGAVQMGVMVAGVSYVVGIDPAHPWLALGLLVLTSLSFTALQHALNAWLGVAGQFLGLVLMVVQLVSVGGTFPWQTLPSALYPAHVLLPMTYAVQGLRQLLYGGSWQLLAVDVAVLVGYLVACLALSVLAVRRQRVWRAPRLTPELVL